MKTITYKPKKFKLKSYTPADVDFAFQKVVSFSQLSLYNQCPHKWYTQYVEKKLQTPPSIHLIFGTAIHHAFQEYLKMGYNDSFSKADKLDLEEIFQNKFIDEYKESYTKNNNTHYSEATEMREFAEDGVAILEWFKKHRKEYFSNRGCQLLGIELPVQKELKKNVIFKGSLDIVIYDSRDETVTIYDLKTSTKGWNDYHKRDKVKQYQLLLYKQYLSELYDIDISKIRIKFLILKRKVVSNEWQEFPKRIQEFVPADGKTSMNESQRNMAEFIKNCFDDVGKPIIKEHKKNFSKLCEYCAIKETCNPY